MSLHFYFVKTNLYIYINIIYKFHQHGDTLLQQFSVCGHLILYDSMIILVEFHVFTVNNIECLHKLSVMKKCILLNI